MRGKRVYELTLCRFKYHYVRTRPNLAFVCLAKASVPAEFVFGMLKDSIKDFWKLPKIDEETVKKARTFQYQGLFKNKLSK